MSPFFRNIFSHSFLSVIQDFFILIFAIMIVSNLLVEHQSRFTYNTTTEIPKNKVGLVLGTSKYLSNGSINLYYENRIRAAIELFETGKIEFLLVSGDNGTSQYDEPTMMKSDLVRRGIPAARIFLDYAGFRTLDSVVRSKHIFGQNQITIISQQFHNERAIYLALQNNVEAIGFNAQDVTNNYGLKTKIREAFARVKMIMDIFLRKKPKFLGAKVRID